MSGILDTLNSFREDVTKVATSGAQVAATAQQIGNTVSSPDFQAEFKEVVTKGEEFLGAQLALQAISTFAVLGLFLIAFDKHRSRK